MLPEEKVKKLLHFVLPIFIAVFSICVLRVKVPETKFVKTSVESIDENNETVMKFSGATLATSVAITLIPDDIATPLADTLADMNKYSVFILMILFFEKMIVTEGTKLVFLYLVPIACLFYVIGTATKKSVFLNFAYKLLVLGLALVLVIPCSTHLVDLVGVDYLAYVNETIEETEQGSEKINEIMTSNEEDGTILERISEAFSSAMDSVEELLQYFKNMIKKCINAVAIMLVTSVLVPILILFFFKWLIAELFAVKIPMPKWKNAKKPDDESSDHGDSEDIEE